MTINIKIEQLDEEILAQLRNESTKGMENPEIKESVSSIIEAVRKDGDAAVIRFTERFDGVILEPEELRVPDAAMDAALKSISQDTIKALEIARDNIRRYHEKQLPEEWELETMTGITTGMLVRPLSKIGIYVPGGKAFYPSTVLMCALPAKVAGVEEIVMVTPPRNDKTVHPVVLAAAKLAGVDKIYMMGGAQAITAMALGTVTIPKVDKITGPGNIYVSTAKHLLQGEVLIDSPAGPSEVLVIGGKSANPEAIALDMCAQAEHDEHAISMAFIETKDLANELLERLDAMVPKLKRARIIKDSLEAHGKIVVSRDVASDSKSPGNELTKIGDTFVEQAVTVINTIAPEHLELMVDEDTTSCILPRIKNAGAIFIGESTPVSLGDYASGTNHVLPTNGMARRYSALSTLDFIKIIPVTKASKEGLKGIAGIVSRLARLEGLEAHARTVEARTGQPPAPDPAGPKAMKSSSS
ncbi:histidinol dehydrogenase [Candidatus Bathyarchaeota archaeon]|nr:histidinol dehydrogenase [Candidatus Bathyarchaeota archaeon]